MKYAVYVTLLSLVISSCQKKTGTTSKGKTFVYCSEGSPTAFNPQITTDGASYTANSEPMYNRLVGFKQGTTQAIPSLATSWEISDDKKTYTFKLRSGVKFHTTSYFTPTRDFNSDDVVYTFNRFRDPGHPYHKVNGGVYEFWSAMEMGKIIKDIKKLGPLSVQFELNFPNAPFIANLAMDFASITSQEYAESLIKQGKKEDFDFKAVGTGPFVFKSYTKDTLIRYNSNPTYWEGEPKIKNLVYAITTDPSVRYQKLKTGECHFDPYPAPNNLADIKKNPKLKVMEKEGFNVGFISMNVEKGPFKKLEVRQAINHALNRDYYIEAIYLGHAKRATNPLPPSQWGYKKGLLEYDYNPQKARDLLKKAGYAKGFKTTLWTLPVSRPYNPDGKKLGELVQADLAKVGITVELISYDWPTYLAKSRKGEHEMMMYGWNGDNGDPDNFLNTLLGCGSIAAGTNNARWCHKEFNDLVTKALRITDKKEREALYFKAQEIFKANAPWVTIAHSVTYKAMLKEVTGYVINPVGTEIFTYIE